MISTRYFYALLLCIFSIGCSKRTVPAATAGNINDNAGTVTPATPVTKVEPAIGPMEDVAVVSGQEIFNSKCGNCHGLKKTEDYSSRGWAVIIDKMAPKAMLNESEKANVLAYVQHYSKKGI